MVQRSEKQLGLKQILKFKFSNIDSAVSLSNGFNS